MQGGCDLDERVHDGWVEVCNAADLGTEDVIRFDHCRKTYAIIRDAAGKLYATDGICTHGNNHLSEGLVKDGIIECPKHNGRFNYKTGQAKRAPVCVDLKTYPVRIEAGKVLVQIG